MPVVRQTLVFVACVFVATSTRAESIREVLVDPIEVHLQGPKARFSLLVHGKTASGRLIDLTSQAEFRSRNTTLAHVTKDGILHARANGSTVIEVTVADQTKLVHVQVTEFDSPRRSHFENDVIPILSRHGCNSSGCHGKAEGQNGFKLSVFGSNPNADLTSIVKESRGRRVFPAAPEHSLLLLKASGGVPHGGGARIRRGSRDYDTLREWIAAGTPVGEPDAPHVVSLHVSPRERVMGMLTGQRLRAVAKFSDGREEDVTAHARFQSNNESLANVDEDGLVFTGEVPGDVAVMASYMGAVDLFRAIVPRAETQTDVPKLVANNFIDTLVFDKLRKLNIVSSGQADDADYLRRVYLDVIGTLPTADEARRFLTDERPDKRARLVEELLKRPEFADYWALKWADLLRVDRQALGHKQAYAYYRWIRESIRANKPLDEFASELLTAEGPLVSEGPTNFFKVVRKPGEMASTVSQVFLGVRIACAECHHHPFDRWSQADYVGMRAFFAPVKVSKSPLGEVLLAQGDPKSKHPRSGAIVHAHALGTAMPEASPTGDRRLALATWLTAKDNPWFARNLANRVWAHFLGRGLVEPVDDMRLTNPATNPALLDALAKHLTENDFDLHALIRTIAASRVYQLSVKPNATNERDEQNYSRALFKRVEAEVLLDMVCQTTGVPEKFSGVPKGSRAIQLWDSQVKHDFLKLFGRPERVSACECERGKGGSVAQVLHFLNSPRVHAKLAHAGGRLAKMVREHTEDVRLVEELYLTFFARFPTSKEKRVAVGYLAQAEQRQEAVEDLAWSMMNSIEFMFNH